jgi:hypothetical protein
VKPGIIIETNEPEKAWNGVRFAYASLKLGHEVKIFLMCAGVEIESITHDKHNAKQMIDDFVKNHVRFWHAEPASRQGTVREPRYVPY